MHSELSNCPHKIPQKSFYFTWSAQKPVLWPARSRQLCILFGRESNRFSSIDLGILANVLSTSLQNWSKFVQPLDATSASTQAHTFSIGLRSGEFPGQSCRSWTTPPPALLFHSWMTSLAAVWHGSLSCCNTNPCMPWPEKILLPSFSSVLFRTSLYSPFVIFLANWPLRFLYPVVSFEVGPQHPAYTKHTRPRETEVEPTPVCDHHVLPAASLVACSEAQSPFACRWCHDLGRPATQALQRIALVSSPALRSPHDGPRRDFAVRQILTVNLLCYESCAAFCAGEKEF